MRMSLSDELKRHYEAVLRDLQSESAQVQSQIAPLQARLKELHYSVRTLAKKLNPDVPIRTILPVIRPTATNQKYVRLSVRWAILDLLSDTRGRSSSEIAEELKAAGIQTKAANFVNNVSAVLTTTMKEEVQQLPDNKWELTETGRDAIDHIRTTPKFRNSIPWSA